MRRLGLFVALGVALAAPASADLAHDAEGDLAHADGLSGRDVYDRVIAHRLRSFYLEATLENGNGQGDRRRTRFRMIWKDFRELDSELLSKTKIETFWPFDTLHFGLQIERRRGKTAQSWAYIPSARRIPRLPIRGMSVSGSAFTFDDIVPPEAEDFLYRRVEDEAYQGAPCYVVELAPRPSAPSEHLKILVSVDKIRDVIVRARYFDRYGNEVKELSLPPSRLERFGESWFPMLATMTDLTSGETSTIETQRFVANPELTQRDFDLGRLESH